MTEEERIFNGMLYAPTEKSLEEIMGRSHRLCEDFNRLRETDTEERKALLKDILGYAGEGLMVFGPIHFHYGKHTSIGDHTFINFNFTVQDDARVVIGSHCNFGPNVTIVTPGHPFLPDERRSIACNDGVSRFVCYAKPVTIGNDCWFGANVTVCPGVTIGDNCIIGAGSVVTKDIPSDSIAVGVPAKVMRQVTDEDAIINAFPTLR